MKAKVLSIFVMAFLAMSFMVGIVAAENDSTISTKGSVNVDDLDSSGIFWNQFQRAFTFNKQKKAEISLKIAEKRMAKVVKLAKEGKQEKAEKEAEEHKQELEKTEEYINEVEVNGDENETGKSLVAIAALNHKMSSHKEKVSAIHKAILEQQADKLSEEQLAHLTKVFEMIESKLEESEEKVLQKQENMRIKYKLQSGKTDKEVEEELEIEAEDVGDEIELEQSETESDVEDEDSVSGSDKIEDERSETEISSSSSDSENSKASTSSGSLTGLAE